MPISLFKTLTELGHLAARTGEDAVEKFDPVIDTLAPVDRILERTKQAAAVAGTAVHPTLEKGIRDRFDVLKQHIAKAGNDPDAVIDELTNTSKMQMDNYLPDVPANTRKILADNAVIDTVIHSDALTDNNIRASAQKIARQVRSDFVTDEPTKFFSDRLEIDPTTGQIVQPRMDEAGIGDIGRTKIEGYGNIKDTEVVDRDGQREISSPLRRAAGAAMTTGTRLNLLGGETLNRMFGRGEQIGKKLQGEAIHILRSGFDDGKLGDAGKIKLESQLTPEGVNAVANVRAAEMLTGPDALGKYQSAIEAAKRVIPEELHKVLTPGTADDVSSFMSQLPNYKSWERNARKNRYSAELADRHQMPAKAQMLVENMANASNHVRQAGRSVGDRGLAYWGDYFGGGKQKSNVASQKAFIDAHESGFKSEDGQFQLYKDKETGEVLFKDKADAFFKKDAAGQYTPASGNRARLWLPERQMDIEDALNASGFSKDPYAIRRGWFKSANELMEADPKAYDNLVSSIEKNYMGDDKISASGSTSAKRIYADMPDHYEELFVSPYEATMMNMKDQANKAGMKYAILDALGVNKLSPDKQGEMRNIIDQAATRLNPKETRQVAQSLVSRIAKTQEMSAGSIEALTSITKAMLDNSLGVNIQKATTFSRAVNAITATLLSQPASWAKQITDLPSIASQTGLKNMLVAMKDVVKNSPEAVDVLNKHISEFDENLKRVGMSNLGKTDKALEIYAHVVGKPFKWINEFTANVAANATVKRMIDIANDTSSIAYKQLREDLIHRGGEEYADKTLIDLANAKATIDVQNEITRVMGFITPHSQLNSPSLKVTNPGVLVDQMLVLKNFMINRMSSVVENAILPLANSKSISSESFKYAMTRAATLLAYMGGMSFVLSNAIDRLRHKKGADEKSKLQIAANTLSIAAGLPEDTLEGIVTKPGMTLGRFAMPTAAAPLGIAGDVYSGVRRATDPSYKPRSVLGTNTLSFVPFAGGITRDVLNRRMRSGIDQKKAYQQSKARMRQMGIEF